MQFLPINNDGTYLGKIISHAIQESAKTGSVSMNCTVALTHLYDKGAKLWEDISAEAYQVYANFIVVGTEEKGNQLQDKTVEAMSQLFEWYSGDFTELAEKDLSNVLIQFSCKTRQDQNGNPKIDGSWIAVPQEHPTGGQTTDPATAKSLTTKYASDLRALAKKDTAPAFAPPGGEADTIPWEPAKPDPEDTVPY